jgi:hypothetical protein
VFVERATYVLAVCLDCRWRRVGASLALDDFKVQSAAYSHVKATGHTVDMVRTDIRTYSAGE